MNASELTRHVKELVAKQGFDACGIAQAGRIGRDAYLRQWLASGRAGSMDYLQRHSDKRIDPRLLLPGARSVIVAALLYHQPEPPAPTDDARLRGRVAMYAWGDDYHQVLKEKLFAVADRLRTELPGTFDSKVCVDTAPLLEREFAAAAGIGWIGKNTMVLNERIGSYFFLGAIVTTLELVPDEPATDHCGTCTACLTACPTDAFPAPYEMDASRCISYLTIEHRTEIDESLAARMEDWVFGCDVCQQVCPHNRHAPHTTEPRFTPRPRIVNPPLDELLDWSTEEYRHNLRGSAMRRAKLDMLQRNAEIARCNAGSRESDAPEPPAT